MAGSELERFEALYRDSPDPWGYQTSAYEREKYASTLDALPTNRRGSCLELGCSIGVLTAMLAERFEHVVAVDFSPAAIRLARRRVGATANVDLIQARFPQEVPGGSFELILCSEFLYYLDGEALAEALVWARAQLAAGASLLAVSWRGPGLDEPFSGDQVHDRIAREFARWHVLDRHSEGYRLDRFDGP